MLFCSLKIDKNAWDGWNWKYFCVSNKIHMKHMKHMKQVWKYYIPWYVALRNSFSKSFKRLTISLILEWNRELFSKWECLLSLFPTTFQHFQLEYLRLIFVWGNYRHHICSRICQFKGRHIRACILLKWTRIWHKHTGIPTCLWS